MTNENPIILVPVKGGPGSGNWGHAGRPGLRGGSARMGTGIGAVMHKSWSVPTKGDMDDDSQYANLFLLLDESILLDESSEDISKRISQLSGVDVDDVEFTHKSWNYPGDKLRGVVAADDQSIRTAADEFNLPVTASGADLRVEDITGMVLPTTDARYRDGHVNASDQRAILRATYDLTQKSLTDAGYSPDDTSTLYRGVGLQQSLEPGSVHPYRGQVIDSWSYEPGLAGEFGTTVIAANIPIRNILDYGVNGFGVAGEGEVSVFGSMLNDVLVISSA